MLNKVFFSQIQKSRSYCFGIFEYKQLVLSDRIFVYGTLLSTVPSAASKWLLQHAQLLGEASFPGALYDLGSYPGFVLTTTSSGRVAGEILQLYDPVAAFAFLDIYEGLDEQEPLYRRDVLEHPDYGLVWTYAY